MMDTALVVSVRGNTRKGISVKFLKSRLSWVVLWRIWFGNCLFERWMRSSSF